MTKTNAPPDLNFGIGDRVRVGLVSSTEDGYEGVIVELAPDNGDDYRVLIDTPPSVGTWSRKLTYREGHLMLISRAINFKAGDWVVVNDDCPTTSDRGFIGEVVEVYLMGGPPWACVNIANKGMLDYRLVDLMSLPLDAPRPGDAFPNVGYVRRFTNQSSVAA